MAGAISGTSRATYLYKFMATCAAICLCQLMTGPDTKVMKTPQSDPDPMRLSSRVSNIARILRTAEQQKSVKCGYFLFKRKNRVCVCKHSKMEDEEEEAVEGENQKRETAELIGKI